MMNTFVNNQLISKHFTLKHCTLTTTSPLYQIILTKCTWVIYDFLWLKKIDDLWFKCCMMEIIVKNKIKNYKIYIFDNVSPVDIHLSLKVNL